jgi:hypothetical protein
MAGRRQAGRMSVPSEAEFGAPHCGEGLVRPILNGDVIVDIQIYN